MTRLISACFSIILVAICWMISQSAQDGTISFFMGGIAMWLVAFYNQRRVT